MIAQSRVHSNPSAAITASRTMLEALLKTIITERGEPPDTSGDLGKLFKQAQKCVRFDSVKQKAEHMVFSGMASVINGIATISNEAGDRHGTVGGKSIEDPYFANLTLNAAGTIGLAFIEMHLLTPK